MTSFPYTGVIAADPAAPAGPASAGSTRTATAPARPAWERPALAGLLVATGVLYIWGLGASGWANAFYSAAAQAASQSWKAFFFGSLDAANAITVRSRRSRVQRWSSAGLRPEICEQITRMRL